MKLSSKAQTLNNLKIKGAIIPKLKIYSCNDFLQNEKKIVNDIIQNFKSKIAIRSSSQEEDQFNKSNAGKYSSFLNVDIKNYWIIKDKINEVINSYKKNKHNQVFFIQEMVNEIKISGVLLTRNLENYSKCINKI